MGDRAQKPTASLGRGAGVRALEGEGVKVVILNQGKDRTFEQDLVKDVLEITSLFSGSTLSWLSTLVRTRSYWTERSGRIRRRLWGCL
ncbi:recombinase family protein [Candidatus Methylacidithermus pantelleriae]|uniref:Uncharacterized protein n=1 Tax=Candidatus Methylacidithermus pantelleriae TaxID=2744239 RepID=A0A8J2BN80_9BACT|nr:hypothetical protein [Candidatus Methylacidithermus pantelleriae]CAF0695406.1 hypothetical protein MPNT_190031 [Candidatus Methylacidithermus pantelleriae]